MRINSISNHINYYNYNKTNCNICLNTKNAISNISFGGNGYICNPDDFSMLQDKESHSYGEDESKFYDSEIKYAKENLMGDKDERIQAAAEYKFNQLVKKQKENNEGMGVARIITAMMFCDVDDWYKRKFRFPDYAEKWAGKIELLRINLLSKKANEEAAEANNKKLSAKRDIEYIESLNNIKETKLKPRLLDLIQAKANGKDVEIPNCVMLTGAKKPINLELIDWCGKNVNGRYIKTNPYEEDLDDVLEEAEENYQRTGDWNLIYTEDLDKLINQNLASKELIGHMKRLMFFIAKKYHSTLIFTSDNPDELDKIALETNRVKRVDTDDVINIEKIKKEDIKKRLNNNKYIKNSPLTAINDILVLCGQDDNKVNFYSTKEDLNLAKTRCQRSLNNMPDKEKEKYLKIIDKCIENAWYIVD